MLESHHFKVRPNLWGMLEAFLKSCRKASGEQIDWFSIVSVCNSPAEIQDDLAIASIENVFVYSDRYGHSDLKSD